MNRYLSSSAGSRILLFSPSGFSGDDLAGFGFCLLQISSSPPLIPHREVSGYFSFTGGGAETGRASAQSLSRPGRPFEEFSGKKPLRPPERIGLGLCRKASRCFLCPLTVNSNPEGFPRSGLEVCLPSTSQCFCWNRLLVPRAQATIVVWQAGLSPPLRGRPPSGSALFSSLESDSGHSCSSPFSCWRPFPRS